MTSVMPISKPSDPGFADRLITTLSKAGMYPRDLAELAGISQEAAEAATRGVFPSAPELYRIAKALRVTMEWLVSGEESGTGAGIPNFEEMVDLQRWQEVEEFYHCADGLIAKDVREAVDLRRRLREELLESDPSIVNKIKRPTTEMIAWAKEQLFQGQVCGIDGTLSRSPSLSGGRARIGVAATTYQGDKIQRVLYVSYRRMDRRRH